MIIIKKIKLPKVRFSEDGFTLDLEGTGIDPSELRFFREVPDSDHCDGCDCYDCNDENLSEDGTGFKPKFVIIKTGAA